MSSHLPELSSNIAYGAAGVITAAIVIAKISRGPNLGAIPAVGSGNWFTSWWAGFKFLTNARDVIQQGYEKYKSTPFKVAEPNRWIVILSKRAHLEEVAKASDEEFSFLEAANDQLQIEYTLGPEVHYNPYHIPVIRYHLTRNIEALCPAIRDEVVTSFTDVLDLKGNEWKSIPALRTALEVVCRVSNRVFVGLPLCRDPNWVDLNIRYTVDMVAGGVIIGLFPKFMRPLATRLLTRVPQCVSRGVRLLRPIIEERQKYLCEYGTEWDDKPNDLLSLLMEEAQGPELTTERLILRVLISNFAAIHTSSNAFTQALFHLALNPQYVQPLREEVEMIVEKDGWSKVGLGKMRKVDSFLKETLRMEGLNIASLTRKAMKDFTFSDGTLIPKGTLISAPTMSLHHDKSLYESPDTFEPFRFAEMCSENGKGLRYQLSSTSTEYLPFGHGKYACPGRFFAVNELKLMLAHIVMTYDVKLEGNPAYPPSLHTGTFISVNPHTKVMFRNRVD